MSNPVQEAVEQVDKDPVQPAAPAAEAVTATVDPDDAEVAAALAAAESDGKAPATPAPAAAAAPAAAQPTPPTPAAAAAPQPSEQPMIPKARFDEVLGQSSAKDIELARLRGENEALKMVKVPATHGAQPAQPAQATPDEQLKALRTERLALAKKFDDGEMGLVAYETEKQKLEDREETIREARLAEKFRPAPAAPQASPPDMRLEEKFQELETAHPMLKTTEVMRDDHWEFLLNEAATQLRNEGVVFPQGPLPPLLRFQLSERVANLSDVYGPIWGAKAAQPQQQPAPPKPGLSPQGQARQQKLEMAQDAPPDVNRLTPSGGQTEFTEDQIANMSDDEILALPTSVRARFSTAS